MFIAHLPAGYLLARRLARSQPDRGALILTGLVASILPDMDLLWFYLIDNRQQVHHNYVFHWPLFWLALAALGFAGARLAGWRRVEPFVGVALACLLLHMALDSVAAEIGWLRPFWGVELGLFEVPARYDWWVWSFVLHWTFLFEILILGWAGIALWQDRAARRAGTEIRAPAVEAPAAE